MHQSTSYLMQPFPIDFGKNQNPKWPLAAILKKNKACVSRNCNTNARIKFIIDTAIDDLEWKNPIDFGANRNPKWPLFPTFRQFSPTFPNLSQPLPKSWKK